MFYKDRSTVLGRIGPKSPSPTGPKDDAVLEMADQLAQAGQQQQAVKNAKLSPFERELLQAWAQD